MAMTLIVLSLLASAAGARGPCSLLAGADILAVQKAAVVSVKESAADGRMVEVRRCYYEVDPYSKSVSLEWTRDREPGGARRQWDTLFHPREDDDRERGEREGRRPSPPQPVPGLGEEAYWVPSHASGAIYAFVSGSFVRVSVGGEGSDAEKKSRASGLARIAIAAVAPPPGKTAPR